MQRLIGIGCGLLLTMLMVVIPSIALASDMGRLSQFLPGSQEDPPWVFVNQGSSFTMTNQGDGGAVTYFYVQPDPNWTRQRAIETVVTLSNGSQGGGGLIFGFDPDAGTYFAYAIDGSGAVRIFRRDQNGFSEIANLGVLAQPNSSNTLTIVENGAKSDFLLNGEFVGAIEGISGGGAGILALGIVEAKFTGFVDGPQEDDPQRADQSQSGQIQPAAEASGSAEAPLRLVPVEILDQTAPFGPTVAYDAMIPNDWTTQGGIVWNPPNGCHRGAQLVWGAEAQDKSYGMGFLPPISWSANNYGGPQTGCIGADLTDAEMVLRTYFDLTPEAQARIIEVSRPPELEPVVQQLMGQMPPPSVGEQWMDAVLVQAEVVEDGRTNEAYILGLTLHWMISQNNGLVQGGPSVARGGNLVMGLVVATPPGQLDNGHPAFAAIMGNLRPRKEWNQAVAQWWANQSRPSNGGASGALAATGTNSGSVTDMMFESWQRREGVNDAGHARSVAGIWETQNYQSSSGTVALSQDYRNAWELNDGSLVLTDDDNFSPMETFNEFGTQLERVD